MAVSTFRRIACFAGLLPGAFLTMLLPLAAQQAEKTPMLTVWGEKLLQNPDAVIPHPKHPRPDKRRDTWLTLNGDWELVTPKHPVPRRIRVPFPVESTLSGIGESTDSMLYRRRFSIPNAWRGRRLLLHFEAVDAEATVSINGKSVGHHEGGYTPFSFDITEATPFRDGVSEVAVHTLEVAVQDKGDHSELMHGKQAFSPGGTRYTGCSGIWQTVWIEAVPTSCILDIDIEPQGKSDQIVFRPQILQPKQSHAISVTVSVEGKKIAETYGGTDGALRLTIPKEHRIEWSPENPHLYDITTRLLEGTRVVDELNGYFALRRVGILRDAMPQTGAAVLTLGDKPIFLNAVIDQGYWPDGLYTPPSDAAIEAEIRTVKMLGFNAIRKHAKLESRRWYYWCDRLGVLVWQDIPGADIVTDAGKTAFRRDLLEIIASRKSHPSLIIWTLFNEGRGQHETGAYVAMVRAHDRDRLIDAASGWNDIGCGDIRDRHKFPGPEMPEEIEKERVTLLGSFGGISLIVPGHLWTEATWGYRHVPDSDSLLNEYERLYAALKPLTERGLVGVAFHQLVDVEAECNGLMTYDRQRIKIPPEKIRTINRGLVPNWMKVRQSPETGGVP